jgi:hypothetical protein
VAFGHFFLVEAGVVIAGLHLQLLNVFPGVVQQSLSVLVPIAGDGALPARVVLPMGLNAGTRSAILLFKALHFFLVLFFQNLLVQF